MNGVTFVNPLRSIARETNPMIRSWTVSPTLVTSGQDGLERELISDINRAKGNSR